MLLRVASFCECLPAISLIIMGMLPAESGFTSSERAPAAPFLVLQTADAKREVRLDSGDVWKLGRSAKCTIELKDEAISRNHAMIQRAETGEYYLIDLGSQNGSFVNDRRVSTPIALRNGDRISVGKTLIVFRYPDQPPLNRPPSLNDFGSTRQIFAQRLVTVLVVDIRDYTVLTNKIAQSVVCQVVGNWFSDAERIMQKHGSGVQKFIGDAVMALWVHQSIEQERREVLHVLRALSEFVEATARLSQRFELPQRLRIGAGLNTGAAAIGSPSTGDLTALGDSVNTAFRLEKATKDVNTDVLLGNVTFDCLSHIPATQSYFHAVDLELKGYEGTVKTQAITFSDLALFLQSLDRTAGPRHTPR